MADCDNDRECEEIKPGKITPKPLPKQCSGGDESGGTNDFNELDNRPKYGGVEMTGNTNIPNLSTDVEQLGTAVEGLGDDVDGIKGVIPEEATAENQLADKQYVDDAVAGGGGGSSPKVLSADDYNYPEANPSRVALWLMPTGEYIVPSGVTAIYNTGGYSVDGPGDRHASVVNMGGKVVIEVFPTSIADGAYGYRAVVDSHGNQVGGPDAAILMKVVDNLTSFDPHAPLSANQGRMLKQMIDKTKIWVNFSDIPASGSTSTGVSVYSSRNMTVGESLTGQTFFTWANSNSDGNYKLCIKDIDGNNSDEELFLTAVKKPPMNTVSPSASAIAEMIFTYYDNTGTKTLKLWTEDVGTGTFKISLT